MSDQPKITFIVPCRNKAPVVEKTVRAVFAQTYAPMDIILSDQGSTDGSYAVMQKLAEEYDGPNNVRLVKCPDTDFKGMAGLNAHLNWLKDEIDADFIMSSSADDISHPERAAKTVKAWLENNKPDYIGCTVPHVNADGSEEQISFFPDRGSRFIKLGECIQYMIGASSGAAWSMKLWDKYGPLNFIEDIAFVFPIMAILENGFYFIDEKLHTFIKSASEESVGFDGQLRQIVEENERQRVTEAMLYQYVYHWYSVLTRLSKHPNGLLLDKDAVSVLYGKITEATTSWLNARDYLSRRRLAPMIMRI